LTPRARELAELLERPYPLQALRQAVQQDLADGLFRETVLGDLEDLRTTLVEAHEMQRAELIQSTINDLVGFCSPRWRSLENAGTSEFEDPEAEE
jgi:hypothetical protein